MSVGRLPLRTQGKERWAVSQIICHLIGDYIIQSDWMAVKKTESWFPAVVHGLTYTLPFLFIGISADQFAIIAGTHMVIDRFRLARYVVWIKNYLAPKKFQTPPFDVCKATGYPPDRPVWLTVWLMIIADNTIHLTINYFVLR